jgi:hypothetical protein
VEREGRGEQIPFYQIHEFKVIDRRSFLAA